MGNRDQGNPPTGSRDAGKTPPPVGEPDERSAPGTVDGAEGGAGGGHWIPDACTLPTAQRPLRTAEFDELLASAVVGVERLGDDRLRLRLRPEAAGRAADLAMRETDCCSFFTFTLTASSGGLTLEARVPPMHAGVLDALADRAANPVRRP
jgi:hypothetical protein